MVARLPLEAPHTWWMRIFAFGNAIRFPFGAAAGAAAERHRHSDADRRHVGLMNCIAS